MKFDRKASYDTGNFNLSLLMFILPFVYFYIFINPYAKEQLKVKGISVNDGFFEHWASDDYFKHKKDCLKENLIANGILKSDSLLDSNLLFEYSTSCRSKSNEINNFKLLKGFERFGSMLIISVLIAIFNFLVNRNIVITSEFVFYCLFSFFAIIVLYIFYRFLIKEILQISKRRLKEISDVLLDLKWSEDLKVNNIHP